MKKKSFISIIIPVYNDESYLGATIESCLNQTFEDIEIVIVDDASTDKTPDVISAYAKKYPQIKTITHSENKKTLQAIKTGVLAANGKYIMVVSGDDTFEPSAAETCVKVVHDNPSVEIVHFGRRVLKNGRQVRTLVPIATQLEGDEILKSIFSLTKGSQGSLSNKFWKKSLLVKVFKQVNPVKKLILGEDQVIVFLAALQAKKYIAITNILHNYNFGMGMDGRSDIDLNYFLEYRLTMADSMDELHKQLKAMKVEGWVWKYALSLKREHYAWSVLYTQHLSESDRFTALEAWTNRTSALDTLIGVVITIPDLFTDEYLAFLDRYQPSGFSAEDCREIVTSIIEYHKLLNEEKNNEIRKLEKKNKRLTREISHFLSVKRSVRLVAGNMKRKVVMYRKKNESADT